MSGTEWLVLGVGLVLGYAVVSMLMSGPGRGDTTAKPEPDAPDPGPEAARDAGRRGEGGGERDQGVPGGPR